MRPILQTFKDQQLPMTIRCRVVRGDAMRSPFHYHPEIEIVYIVEGRTRWMVGDHIDAFEPGNLFIFGPDLPHQVIGRGGSAGRGSTVNLHLIQFRREGFGESFLGLPELNRVREVLDRSVRGLHFSGEEAAKAGAEMGRMIRAPGTRRMSQLLALLEHLGHSARGRPLTCPGYLTTVRPGLSERFDQSRAYVLEHFQDPSLTQARVGDAIGMSASAFSRFFAGRYGQPFSDFLNEVRIGQACRMLQESDATIGEISFACGFANLSNFNRRFRGMKGLTPSAFRKAVHLRWSGAETKMNRW